MPFSTTGQELVDDVRFEYDYEPTQRVTDDQILRLLSRYARQCVSIVDAEAPGSGWRVAASTVVTTPGANSVAIPSNVGRVLSVWIRIDDYAYQLERMDIAHWPAAAPTDTKEWGSYELSQWALSGSDIVFDCPPDAAYTLYVQGTSHGSDLTAGSGFLGEPEWADWVVASTVAKLFARDGKENARYWQGEAGRLEALIRETATSRLDGTPHNARGRRLEYGTRQAWEVLSRR